MKLVRRVGRLRWKLAAMLQALGFIAQASEITQNAPVCGTLAKDGTAWQVYASIIDRGTVCLFSYDTMKDCCAKGITVSKTSDGLYEVLAVACEHGPAEHNRHK